MFYIIKDIYQYMDFNNSYAELGAALVTGILSPILVQYIKAKYTKPIDPVKEASEHNVVVYEQLQELLNETGCDRIWLSQFHNGGHFYPTGKSIQKFSMIYECVSDGTESIQDQFQNIPISLFTNSMHHLLTEDCICIPEVGNNTPYGLQYAYVDNPKSIYMFALKDIKNRFMGTLGIEFVNNQVDYDCKNITNLQIKITRIASILEQHLNK